MPILKILEGTLKLTDRAEAKIWWQEKL